MTGFAHERAAGTFSLMFIQDQNRQYYYDVASPVEKTPIDFKFGVFIYERDGELEVIGNIYESPELLKT